MRPRFDRGQLRTRPLGERRHRLSAERIMVDPDRLTAAPPDLGALEPRLRWAADRARAARAARASVILACGAHAIKNGLGPVIRRLAEQGWITHFATNGGSSVHDWELAAVGETAESVRDYLDRGQFGLWEETGRSIGLAVAIGAAQGMGYGEALGRLIEDEGMEVPTEVELRARLAGPPEQAAAAADLLALAERVGLPAGRWHLPHPHKAYSVFGGLAAAGVPCTVHPGIGYDIVHEHPAASGGAYGRAAYRDFLSFTHSVSKLEGGLYLSVGSAVMSPMILEKALAMARNAAASKGGTVKDFSIVVVDLEEAPWDWRQGEPPEDNPAYYLRHCKSFSRMGADMEYVAADNRAFLGRLWSLLAREDDP